MMELVCVGEQRSQLSDITSTENLVVRTTHLFAQANEWAEKPPRREVLWTSNPHECFQDMA